MGIITYKGFHTTTSSNARVIKTYNRFYESKKDNEWLGKGIYFWFTHQDAIYWLINSNYKTNDMCIISVDITLDDSKVLNLDNPNEVDKFLKVVSESIEEFKKRFHKNPTFKNHYQQQCYYCNVYKKKINTQAIICTFAQEFNIAGFKTMRKQICVHENKYVKISSYEDLKRSDFDAI